MNPRKQFFEAFASRPQPSDTQILRPAVSQNVHSLHELLAAKTSTELSAYELRNVVEGYLWTLSPEAFLYFLPGFLYTSLKSYASVSVFASELVGTLTKPTRSAVQESFDLFAQMQSDLNLPNLTDDMVEQLRKQQLEWFDSGTPMVIFHERFDSLTREEGSAILSFFVAFKEAHGSDFPFGELETAVDRYWKQYKTSCIIQVSPRSNKKRNCYLQIWKHLKK